LGGWESGNKAEHEATLPQGNRKKKNSKKNLVGLTKCYDAQQKSPLKMGVY